MTVIQTSDGKTLEIENDCLIRKSEAIRRIYELCQRLDKDNHDTRNGLAGAVAILDEMEGENGTK